MHVLQQHVACFQVAMHNALAVQVRHTIGSLKQARQHLCLHARMFNMAAATLVPVCSSPDLGDMYWLAFKETLWHYMHRCIVSSIAVHAGKVCSPYTRHASGLRARQHGPQPASERARKSQYLGLLLLLLLL